LLCATILSAQCTDARVNMVTPALFDAIQTRALSPAARDDVESIVRTTTDFSREGEEPAGMAAALVGHGGRPVRSPSSCAARWVV
jgi:endonuclease-3